MKIAIHYTPGNNFSPHWKNYCETNNITHQIVNCYDNNIIKQIKDCDALMWHVNNFDYRDQIFAKSLIRSVEEMGIKAFPNSKSIWYFDDKVAQKYILEAIGAPLAYTFVFYDKKKALEWAEETNFPKVFKLRKGSGSNNVIMAKSRNHAKKLICKMFGQGIKPLNMVSILKERYRKYKLGKEKLTGLLKGIIRLLIGTPYLNMSVREKGYIYFQDYIPGNNYDIRVVVIGDKAFAIKRMVRENDFRASGSGNILYDKNLFDENEIKLSFDLAARLQTQCVAFDYVHHKHNPIIVEISYGFSPKGYYSCPGYWDINLNYQPGTFNPYGWMVEDLIKSLM